MKFLNIIGLVFLGFQLQLHAQQQQVSYKTQDYRNYQQFTLFAGYDNPITDPDFNYLKYKGDLITGITYNNFWNSIGVQAEISYAFTGIDSDFNTPVIYYNSEFGQTSTINSFTYYKDNLKKLFLGLGPSFKYQSKNDKFVIDASVMGGLGIVQKGAYVQVGVDENFSNEFSFYGLAMNYHSGFDRQSIFALKGNLRFNYFINPEFGLFLGGYYMNYFGAIESDRNPLLVDYDFQNIDDTYYYFEPVTSPAETPINGIDENWDYVDVVRSSSQDNRGKFDLASLGIMGGVSWKINRTTLEIRCPNGYFLCEKDGLCYLDNNCGIASENTIEVLAKDKLSGKTIEGVSIGLIQKSDQSDVASGITASNGMTDFSNVPNGDYSVNGSLGAIELSPEEITSVEFNDTGKLQKTVYYDNPNFLITGKATDCVSGAILGNTKVKAVNSATIAEVVTTTNAKGEYAFSLPSANYVIEVVKDNYFSERKVTNLTQMNRSNTANVIVNICGQLLECNNSMKFNNLLFKFNDYHIESGSTDELDNLAEFMKVNPNVKLEISAYTDSRGSDSYNMKLSQERAEETVKYLVDKGVPRNRLIAKGYGETHLLNGCSNGVPCTEEEQAINRRTEFKVICDTAQ